MRLRAVREMETGRLLRAVMCAIAASFLVGALFAPDLREIFSGLGRIVTSPAQLTRDFFLADIGSVSGAMLNYALVGAACCALMFLPEAKVNGVTVLAFMLTLGFSSWGINFVNLLPMFLGTFVYARIRRQPFGRFIHFAMFSTGLAPLVSEALFRYPGAVQTHGPTPTGVVLALLIGLVTGCAMPALCAHSPAFHKGYNLYNAGPAAGFLCLLLYAALYRVRGVDAPAITATLGAGNRTFVNAFCAALFALCVALGLWLNGGLRGYRALLTDPGFRSDFTQRYGAGLCVLNLGVYGLFILLYYNLIGATFTGVTMGCVFCMACCAMNGATPVNVFPIMLGYVAMGLLNRAGVTAFPVNAQAIVVGLCYASGLAPISGAFGVPAGIVAGMLHYVLVTSVPVLHGGFNLYNGGFTAGIVCFLFVPILEHYFRKREKE